MSMGVTAVSVIVPMVVMRVTAMLIVMMIMIMIMVMVMVMAVRMTMGVIVLMVLMIVRVAMRMLMAAAFIGTAFRVEWRLDLDHARAQSLDHGVDDVIPADAQAFCHDLRRQMPVAEMPGDTDQMLRIARLDLEQRLGSRHHFDEPPIFQDQRVAAAQCHGVFEVEQEFEAAGAGHRHSSPVAIVEVEHDGVGRRVLPAMLHCDSGGADHAINPGRNTKRRIRIFRPCRR